METPTIVPILKKIPVFAELSDAELNELVKTIILNYFPVGHVFFNEGDAVNDNSCMYIIKHGMVKISRKEPTPGTDKEVAVLSDNDFFGEMAFVFNEPRNATATVVADAEVFELKKDVFLDLMQSNASSAQKISQEFIHRVKENNKAS